MSLGSPTSDRIALATLPFIVMAGLVPAIHPGVDRTARTANAPQRDGEDGCHKAGHDGKTEPRRRRPLIRASQRNERLLTGNDSGGAASQEGRGGFAGHDTRVAHARGFVFARVSLLPSYVQ